ncbi:MAG TPA: ATP-binding cassette domain-containing protein [Actinomycetota bacterium]
MTQDTLEQEPAAAGQQAPVAVSVTGLVRHFGEIEAVKGVTFDVGSGEIFAFLGPNGAGKSTTIKMLCTLLRPTAGHATVAGYDVAQEPKAVRANIGLVFQERTLDEQLTAEENLAFHGALYGIPQREIPERSARVLEMVGLTERRGDLVSTFSGGMARRLEIARGLMHAPTVLFLDEPTIGLDPQTRARIWEDVQRLRDEHGVTVFMTTHYMDEAEYADRIAIIDRGTIVAMGSPAELKASVGLDTVLLSTADDRTAAARLEVAGFDLSITSDGVLIRTADGESAVPVLIDRAGVPVRLVRVRRPTLDDVFLHYTGREMRSEPEMSSMIRQIIAARRR